MENSKIREIKEKFEENQDQELDKEENGIGEDEYQFVPETTFTQDEIIEAVNAVTLHLDDKIKATKALRNMVFFILKQYFINKKRFVIAECPTGSGKTIIGLCTYFAIQYLYSQDENKSVTNPRVEVLNEYAYYLTSNKLLQDQINNDILRFKFEEYLYLLKGVDNYPCLYLKKEFEKENSKLREIVLAKNPLATFASYSFRPCAAAEKTEFFEGKYSKCYPDCPYKNARAIASGTPCTVLNYAYFLNIMRNVDKMFVTKFFYRRLLTISDEAHLIPDIVTNMFNFEFTQQLLSRIQKLLKQIYDNFGNIENFENALQAVHNAYRFYYQPINKVSEILDYIDNMKELSNELVKLKTVSGDAFERMFSGALKDFREDIKILVSSKVTIQTLISERPEDVYFESEVSNKVSVNGKNIHIYKHVLKDLKEAECVRKNFLDKMKLGLFMSATIGDMDEYAKLMGMKDDEYVCCNLPSTFDFSRSPIYLCDSGYLNFNNINQNIDKVLFDTIRICNMHPKEKGVIHTATFKIANQLRDKILNLGNTIDYNRFIFYQNSKEKEMLIDKFKDSFYPYIFVGPSLYEGIDLPDDKCRFQILIKVPYAQINPYIKKKMERYPFWYKRNCLEKIVQAIGRSNRHKNDYSTIYLLDSCFDKIIFDIADDSITGRIQYKKIY